VVRFRAMVDPLAASGSRVSPRELLRRHAPALILKDGAWANGSLAVLLLDFRRHSGPPTESELSEFASLSRLSVHQVKTVSDFVATLLSNHRNRGETLICSGLTCSLHGAERLHKALEEVFLEDSLPWMPREVHCLGQCDAGPSIRVGRCTHVTRTLETRTDTRVWRETDGGAFSVEPS
jgi:NADH:ubiquinone oxidoreductase subunit E